MFPRLTDSLEFIGLIIGTVTAIIVVSKKGRMWCKRTFKEMNERRKMKRDIPVVLSSIQSTLEQIDKRLKKVEYEVTPNTGGNVRDTLKIIRAEIEATNWLAPKPLFRTTSQGLNIFVNDAYCQLCGTSSEELMRLGWMNFAVDLNEINKLYDRWELAAKQLSPFTGNMKIKSKKGEYRGEWTVSVRLLGPLDTGDHEPNHLWHGSLSPVDDIAKELAKEFEIIK